MARKRMIDPSLWADDGFAELTPRQQLLYVGLFSNADDDGRIKAWPAAIALMLPAVYRRIDDDEIAADLDAVLACMGQTRRYEAGGRSYVAFLNYRRWQRIDKPSASTLPSPPASFDEPSSPPADDPSAQDANGRRTVADRSLNDPGPIPPNRKEEKRTEEKGGEQKADARPRAAAPPAASAPFALVEAMCAAQGEDVSVLSRRDIEKQCAAGKRLVEGGATPEDVRRMVGWLRSQSWVEGGVDLVLVEKQVGKWRLAGKPEAAKPRASPNGRRTAADRLDSDAAEFRRLLAAEQGGHENVIEARGTVR